ncbi:hypothetical protein ES703_97404 [subsurface metagenome]
MTWALVDTEGDTYFTASAFSAMALASPGVIFWYVPPPPWTPRKERLPGRTKRRFVPIDSKRFSTSLLAPCPMLIVVITAPTPMIMPRAVRKERILFRLKALKETRIVLNMFIFLFLHFDGYFKTGVLYILFFYDLAIPEMHSSACNLG